MILTTVFGYFLGYSFKIFQVAMNAECMFGLTTIFMMTFIFGMTAIVAKPRIF